MKEKNVQIVILILLSFSIIINIVTYKKNIAYTNVLETEVRGRMGGFCCAVLSLQDTLNKIQTEKKYTKEDIELLSRYYRELSSNKDQLVQMSKKLSIIVKDTEEKAIFHGDINGFLERSLFESGDNVKYEITSEDNEVLESIKLLVVRYYAILTDYELFIKYEERTEDGGTKTQMGALAYLIRFSDPNWKTVVRLINEVECDDSKWRESKGSFQLKQLK